MSKPGVFSKARPSLAQCSTWAPTERCRTSASCRASSTKAVESLMEAWFAMALFLTQVAKCHLAPKVSRFLSIIVQVPVHEGADPGFDRRRRRVVEGGPGLLHVGLGAGDVTGLHGEQIELGLAAQLLLQHPDVAHQLDPLAVSEVEDAPGGDAAGGGVGF